MTINPFAGRGLRRYTKKHLRHDRDAARAECKRSAQTNLRLNEEKDVLAGRVRDLTQQLEVSTGVIKARDKTIRDQASRIAELEAGREQSASETTQSIPRAQLPQGDEPPRRPSWAAPDADGEVRVLADRLVQGVAS